MDKMNGSEDRFMTVEKFISDLIVFHGEIQKLKASESYYKKLSETFQEGEKNWKSMLQNFPGKIFLKDKNGKYIFCNEEFARGLQLKPEMVIGKSDGDLFPSEFTEQVVSNDRRILEKGRAEESEEKFFYDTKEITVNFFRIPIKNETGDVVGLMGVFSDITGKKEKEEELRNKSARLEELLSAQKDQLYEISAKYEKEVADNGILREKYLDLRNSFTAQTDEFNGINAKYQKEVAEGGVLKEKIKKLEGTYAAQTDEFNRISAKYQKEVAEGENLKEKIQKLEETYQILFENEWTAIAEIKEDAIIATMNEGFQKLTGLDRVEVEGRMNIKDLFANEDLEKVNEVIFSAGGPHPTNGRNEFNLLDRDMNVRVVSMFARPKTTGRGCLLFLKDMTDSKQAQEKLREAISQFRGLMNEMEKTLNLN